MGIAAPTRSLNVQHICLLNKRVRCTSKTINIKRIKPYIYIAGIATSQAQNKKHLSPSTRKRNALRISQWKAKRYEAVVDTKTCVETQTDDKIPITDESTQTETHRRTSHPQPNNSSKGAIDPDNS